VILTTFKKELNNCMKKFIPYIAIGLAIIIGLLLIPAGKQKKFDSRITLSVKDKIPYGTYAAYTVFQQLYPDVKLITNHQAIQEWPEADYDSGKQVLVIVAKSFTPSETDLDYLTGFAQKGNTVVISAMQMNYEARKFFKVRQRFESGFAETNIDPGFALFDSFSVRLDSATFEPPHKYGFPGMYFDNIFKEYDSTIAFPIGYSMKNEPDMLAFYSGKGAIYVQTSPVTFTNFFVLHGDNYKYLERIAALFPEKPRRVVWDEYFLYKKESGEGNGKGLLSVILQYPNFQWAFWLAMLFLALYIATEIWRKQRIVPEYGKPANEYMEFVSTIGKLYYEKGDHQNLAEKMVQFFLEYVRQKYKLNTQYVNSEFAHALAVKTAVGNELAEHIVTHIQQAQMGAITATELKQLYDLLETFYKKA
jgi:hypothetical protein